MNIIVRYQSIDHFSQRRTFKTLEGARKYAFKRVGKDAEISWNFYYAVSSDGVGKITCDGVSIFKLMDRENELNQQ